MLARGAALRIQVKAGEEVVPVGEMEWDAFSKHLVYRHHVDPRALNADVPGFTAAQARHLVHLYRVYHRTLHRLNYFMQSHTHAGEET